MTKQEIINYLSEKKPAFKQEFGVTEIGLFGSFARGNNRIDSDIDIVVEMKKPDFLALVGVKQKIEEDLGIQVDVVRKRDRMNSSLKKRIEQDALYA